MIIKYIIALIISIYLAIRYHKRNINNPNVNSKAYATVLTIYTFFIILLCVILIEELGEIRWT